MGPPPQPAGKPGEGLLPPDAGEVVTRVSVGKPRAHPDECCTEPVTKSGLANPEPGNRTFRTIRSKNTQSTGLGVHHETSVRAVRWSRRRYRGHRSAPGQGG